MNILILQGSPCVNGNTTWMAEELHDNMRHNSLTPDQIVALLAASVAD